MKLVVVRVVKGPDPSPRQSDAGLSDGDAVRNEGHKLEAVALGRSGERRTPDKKANSGRQ